MSSTNHKLRLAGALAVLATLALAVSCRGFFVKPTLTSVAVGPPTPTIDTGTTTNTVQMFAVGTFNGSGSSNVAVDWTISSTGATDTTITAGGLVQSGALPGTATVTATAIQNPTISGTQTVTVNLGNVTALVLDSPGGYTISAANNTTPATATATAGGKPTDVSSTAIWSTGDNTVATVQGGTTPAVITGVAPGNTTVTAKYTSAGTTFTATANVTVN